MTHNELHKLERGGFKYIGRVNNVRFELKNTHMMRKAIRRGTKLLTEKQWNKAVQGVITKCFIHHFDFHPTLFPVRDTDAALLRAWKEGRLSIGSADVAGIFTHLQWPIDEPLRILLRGGRRGDAYHNLEPGAVNAFSNLAME